MSTLLILLTWPIGLLTYTAPYYYNAFERYNVYTSFPEKYSRDKINQEFGDILKFIQPSTSSSLDIRYFSYEDVTHMQDVQRLLQMVYNICLASFITTWIVYLILFRANFSLLTAFSKTIKVFQDGLLVVAGGVLLFLAFWQYTFTGIHQLLFSNNNYWQLDPQTSNLIKYLPAQIFQELLVIYMAIVMIEFFVIRYIAHRRIKSVSQITV